MLSRRLFVSSLTTLQLFCFECIERIIANISTFTSIPAEQALSPQRFYKEIPAKYVVQVCAVESSFEEYVSAGHVKQLTPLAE